MIESFSGSDRIDAGGIEPNPESIVRSGSDLGWACI